MPRAYRAPLDACTKVAAGQYGALSKAQATAAGLSLDAIQRLVSDDVWKRILPATYVLRLPRTKDERWKQRVMAGCLWLGPGSGASHRAGSVLWELEGVANAPVELSTTRQRQAPNSQILLHRVDSLPASDVTVRHAITVTTITRTLVDLASVVDEEVLEMAVESALRRRLVKIRQIEAALDRRGATHRGTRVLRRLLRSHPGKPTESFLETLVSRLLRDPRLPPAVRQYVIRDPLGVFVARVDFAYPAYRVAVEADGFERHSGKAEFARDRTRQNRLARLGWTTYHVTWDDVKCQQDLVVAEITAFLEAAGWRTSLRPRNRGVESE